MKLLNEILGTRYPIIQGGMANIATGEFTAACSNAGALGIIGAGGMNADTLRENIRRCKALTDKPFGLNIMLMSPTAGDALELAAKYRVPVVTTGAGQPGKVIERLKPLGTIVIPVVAAVALAERVEKQGADAVVAEGMESGGHIGETTTMNLVPQVADAVKIPVIAAGGIADGRGMAAAFMLGASGVQMGTRFVCASECNAHVNYKEKIVKANDRATMLNLMVGLNGYTLCSGIICSELNGDDYIAVPLESDACADNEQMEIGYIVKKHQTLSRMGMLYIEKAKAYLAACAEADAESPRI